MSRADFDYRRRTRSATEVVVGIKVTVTTDRIKMQVKGNGAE